MIRHLVHSAIDKAHWDALLLRATNRMWYARSAVLDIVAPGWEALIDEERGAIMPLPWRSRWGFHYLFQPYGVQQFGVFAPQYDDALGQRFIDAVPARFRYWDVHVNAAMQDIRFDRVMHSTQQEIPVLADMVMQRAAYSQGHRRNLRKVEHFRTALTAHIGADAFMDLYARTTAVRFGPTKARDLETLRELVRMLIAHGQGQVLGMVEGEELLAAAVFVEWEGRSILLKSAVQERAQERSPMFLIIDEYLSRGAGGSALLDLAGSNTPSVQRFNAGFGARASVYLHLIRNRLPPPLRWYKQRTDGI
jgi:hypothetical protein